LMSFMSLPSFDNKVMPDSLCESGNAPVLQCFQESRIKGPVIHQSFLLILYGIPCGLGYESVREFEAARRIQPLFYP
jgi:hypothetical protein